MKWMPSINKELKEIKKVEKESNDPITMKDIEQAVELISTANKLDTFFRATFYLAIGEFSIDSDAFKAIKILKKTKNEEDRLVIGYCDTLLSTETTVKLKDIYNIKINISFTTEEKQV